MLAATMIQVHSLGVVDPDCCKTAVEYQHQRAHIKEIYHACACLLHTDIGRVTSSTSIVFCVMLSSSSYVVSVVNVNWLACICVAVLHRPRAVSVKNTL